MLHSLVLLCSYRQLPYSDLAAVINASAILLLQLLVLLVLSICATAAISSPVALSASLSPQC
jgi:hypothetical protein